MLYVDAQGRRQYFQQKSWPYHHRAEDARVSTRPRGRFAFSFDDFITTADFYFSSTIQRPLEWIMILEHFQRGHQYFLLHAFGQKWSWPSLLAEC